MPRCNHCGKKAKPAFTCTHCGKTFCAAHRLPEDHACHELFWYQMEQVWGTKRKYNQRLRKIRLFFVRNSGKFLCVALIIFLASSLIGNIRDGIRDPSYQEALFFITSDKTDQHPYTLNYTCANFASDFQNNAFQAGYRCGYVLVHFVDSKISHALNCFNTTDRGLIFLEPQKDDIMQLVIGEPYWNRTRYGQPDYDDRIQNFTVSWDVS